MLNCDYANNTAYTFNNELCRSCNTMINNLGITPEAAVTSALQTTPRVNQWVQLFVPIIDDMPTQKPSMEGIVSVNSFVKIISQRVINTPTVTGYTNASGVFIPGASIPNAECTLLTGKKLIIEGVITQKVIYTSLAANQALHSATFMVPFSAFIVIDGNTPLSQEFKISVYVEDVFVCMLSERSIFSNSTLFIKASLPC